MIANNTHRQGRGGADDSRPNVRRAEHAPERHDVVPPDYVRLAYERIDRTDDLLARMELVLVAARRRDA